MPDFQQHIISPVIDDIFLPEGLLPFTEFRYPHSMIDPRMFLQDVYWMEPNGQAVLLDSFHFHELEDLLKLIIDFSGMFHEEYLMYELNFLLCEVAEGREEPIKALLYEYEESLNLPHVNEITPQEWIEGTVLYKSLVERINAQQE